MPIPNSAEFVVIANRLEPRGYMPQIAGNNCGNGIALAMYRNTPP